VLSCELLNRARDKLRRLSPHDIWAIEIMLAKRIPKPEPVLPQSLQPLYAGVHRLSYRGRQAA
jgi:hypothetical protein